MARLPYLEPDQVAQLGVFGQRGLRPDRLLAGDLEFVVQLGVVALGVEGLVEPVDQVAGRLQGAVGDVLKGAEDRADAALDPQGRQPGVDRATSRART